MYCFLYSYKCMSFQSTAMCALFHQCNIEYIDQARIYSSGRDCQKAQPAARQTLPPRLPSLMLQPPSSWIFLKECATYYSSSWYLIQLSLSDFPLAHELQHSPSPQSISKTQISPPTLHSCVANTCGLLWHLAEKRSQQREAVGERPLTSSAFFSCCQSRHNLQLRGQNQWNFEDTVLCQYQCFTPRLLSDTVYIYLELQQRFSISTCSFSVQIFAGGRKSMNSSVKISFLIASDKN